MIFLELKNKLKGFQIFSINDIKKIYPNFHSQNISYWQKKGYIKKITKEFYVFSDTEINENTLFLIANKIYPHSYISLETVFSYYNFIPESVYAITSVTSGKTKNFKSQIGYFIYRRIKPNLLFGYDLIKYDKINSNRAFNAALDISFKIAQPEKAVCDYFYLNPHIKSENDFKELRFNNDEFLEKTDLKKLAYYANLFKNKCLEKRLKKFMEFICNA